MEAPGQLADKEDSMPSSTLRTTAAGVILTALLGLSAATAQAQPTGERPAAQLETNTLERLWLWLSERWAPSAALESIQEAITGTDWTESNSTEPGSLNRGGVYDPNGRS